MEPQELASYLKKELLKKGADDVVLSVGKDNRTQIKFSNNKVSVVKNWDTIDLGIFIAQKKKVVTTSIKDFSIKTAGNTITSLIKYVKSAKPNNEYEGIA